MDSTRPEELDAYSNESTPLMDCQVPWDFLAGGAPFSLTACCGNSQHAYSFQSLPAASAPPASVVATQYTACSSTGSVRTYFQNLQVTVDAAALAAALPTMPYLWRSVFNDKDRRSQSAAQRKPLRIIMLGVAGAPASQWLGQGFVAVGDAAFVALPPGGPALSAALPMTPSELAGDSLALLQYDPDQLATLLPPTAQPLPLPGGNFAARPAPSTAPRSSGSTPCAAGAPRRPCSPRRRCPPPPPPSMWPSCRSRITQ